MGQTDEGVPRSGRENGQTLYTLIYVGKEQNCFSKRTSECNSLSLSLNISGQSRTLLKLKLVGILTINLYLT
jgi:hypothetical protein